MRITVEVSVKVVSSYMEKKYRTLYKQEEQLKEKLLNLYLQTLPKEVLRIFATGGTSTNSETNIIFKYLNKSSLIHVVYSRNSKKRSFYENVGTPLPCHLSYPYLELKGDIARSINRTQRRLEDIKIKHNMESMRLRIDLRKLRSSSKAIEKYPFLEEYFLELEKK